MHVRTRTPVRRRSMAHPRLLVAALVAAGLLGAATLPGVLEAPRPAGAAVEPATGFDGVVDGFRSWYGSYRLGDQGEVWCVDHAIAAPDVVLGYEPTGLEERAPETRRAVAWAVGRYGPGADRVTAAALMLVLHDLMGAVYPSGPLSVDAIGPERLEGFDGRGAEVVATARRIKADAVARAPLVGPLVLTAEAEEVAAGRPGELRTRLTDAIGAPVEGVIVHPAVSGAELAGEVDRTSDAEGRAAWPYVAGAGPNRFEVSASVPGAELLALRPTRGVAQRVVRPAAGTLEAVTAFEGVVARRLTIHKRGDAEPRLPVAGARFEVDGREVEAGADGMTPPIELLPGTYTVTEVAPPAGYALAGPWTVAVADADVVLEVLDHAVPGRLRIDKVDARTGAPLDGARFTVLGDLDTDPGTFEVEVADATGPVLPGRYEVREVAAPPHHRLDPERRVVEVRGGETTVLRWPNVALATVAFEKRPALAGAVFVVRTGAGDAADEVARCTTATDGRCTVAPDVIDAGMPFCWKEVVAPPGWGLAEGTCLAAGEAGSVTTVVVDEPPLAVRPPEPLPPPLPQEARVEVLEAPPVATPTPTPTPPAHAPAPAPAPVNPPARVVELPRTGLPLLRWAGVGMALVGAGLLLVVSRGTPPAAEQR